MTSEQTDYVPIEVGAIAADQAIVGALPRSNNGDIGLNDFLKEQEASHAAVAVVRGFDPKLAEEVEATLKQKHMINFRSRILDGHSILKY